MIRFKVKRTPRQLKCTHTHFELLYIHDGVAIGYCPDCDLQIKMSVYGLEESYYGI